MTVETLATIFMGEITKWNDPKLAVENKGVVLPDAAITVVHRSEGSGTTAIFTDYLSKVSIGWKRNMVGGGSAAWPVGSLSSFAASILFLFCANIFGTLGRLRVVDLPDDI